MAPKMPIRSTEALDLIRDYGTPLFVVRFDVLRTRYKRLLACFRRRHRRTVIAYSYKTNYLPGICQKLHDFGAWAEIVSGFEFEIAKSLNIDGQKIIVNGPYKPLNELATMVRDGCLINIDSLQDLETLIRAAERARRAARLGIRLSANVGKFPWTKFGFAIDGQDLRDCIRAVKGLTAKLVPTAIHMHVGTNIVDVRLYRDATREAVKCAAQIERELNTTLSIIDVGGGFATQGAVPVYEPRPWRVPPIEDYADAICSTLTHCASGWGSDRVLVLEPGRILVDDAVILLSTVAAIKHAPEHIPYMIIDAGVNILPSAYYRHHMVTPLYRRTGKIQKYDIFGPLCMQADFVQGGVDLPPAKPGDLLAIHNAGAYSISQSTQFMRPRPAVVGLDGAKAKVIRRAETTRDILWLDSAR